MNDDLGVFICKCVCVGECVFMPVCVYACVGWVFPGCVVGGEGAERE